MINASSYLYRLAWRIFFNVRHPTSLIARIKYIIFPKDLMLSQATKNKTPKISIIIITFGALEYVKKCFSSLHRFRPQNSEIIVYDNGSDSDTLAYIQGELSAGRIDKLHLSSVNCYFVRGNNEAAKLASDDSEYYLLLNSDTEIMDVRWIDCLLQITPQHGVSSMGYVSYPFPRPDGWCFMVDAKTFKEVGGLNDHYQMNWGITDFTSRILEKKLPARSIINPDRLIIHHGSKSYGKRQRVKKFNFMTTSQVIRALAWKSQEFFKIK